MAISILTPIKKIECYEGEYIDEKIYYKGTNVIFSRLSSTLPSTITLINDVDENGSFLHLFGTTPLVKNDTEYLISYRLTETINGVKDFVDGYFQILNKNKMVSWSSDIVTEFSPIMMTDFSYQLLLDNASGNEIFKKIEGNLPNGISISNSGLISGTILESNEIDTPYHFTIGVYIDNEMVQTIEPKSFTFYITNAFEDTPPIWMTESGVIGSLSVGEVSYCKVSAYNTFGNSSISYSLDEHADSSIYRLPPGLSIKPLTGEITGILTTTQIAEWRFKIVASKIASGAVIESEPREFIIRTNEVSDDHKITWNVDNNDLGDFYIGNTIVGQIPLASVEDDSTITYSISGGNVPDGLLFNKDGTLSGILGNQPLGSYSFVVKAETKYTYIEQPFIMKIQKGLGKNAIKTYLRFNLEYKNEYNNIRDQLNPRTTYKNDNENFFISPFPTIYIANLCCYDREILSYMLNFGNPEIIRIGKTKSLTYSQINSKGDSIENYEVIFKTINESTYQWDKIEIGDFDFNSKLQQMKSLNQIEEYAQIEFNNEIYDSNIEQLNEDGEMVTHTTNPHVTYNVFNFENVRKILAQKIYVYKKFGTYYYDLGSQQLFNEDDVPQYHLQQISDPWCFDMNNTSQLIQITNLSKDDEMVMPMITDDDVEQDGYGNYYVQFLKTNIESLPQWKRAQPLVWSANTEYNMNDIIINNNTYYKVLQRFKSGSIFTYDTNTLKIINNLELEEELQKVYYPTLDLGYFEPGTNRNYMNVMNDREIQYGDFWYNKDFLFYEVICEPIFNKDIETFGVSFVPLEQQEYEKPDRMVKFEIICPTEDANIIINNSNENPINVVPGSRIKYSVSKDKHYTIDNGDGYRIITDESLYIELKKKVIYKIDVQPSDAIVTMKTEKGTFITKELEVAEGTHIEYTIVKDGYVTKSGSVNAKALVEKDGYYEHLNEFILTPIYKLTIETLPVVSPSLGREIVPDVSLVADGWEQVENSISVSNNTMVEYLVSAEGLTSRKGSVRVNKDMTITITLQNDAFTLTVNPEPKDSKVIISSEGAIGSQKDNSLIVKSGTPITCVVSHDGYATQTINIAGISSDTVYNIYLGEYVTLTLNPKPSDAKVSLSSSNYQQVNNSMTVLKGSSVSYLLERFGYANKSGRVKVEKDTDLMIEMDDLFYFVPENNDTDGFVMETNENQYFKGE
jgi:hypothetical protein